MVDPLNLLALMRCVMRTREGWAARAEGCEVYGYGDTPEAAMVDACSKLLPGEGDRVPLRRPVVSAQDELPGLTRRRIIE